MKDIHKNLIEVMSQDAPEALGPYSQAIIFQNLIFCSGQIAIDPLSGNLVSDNIEEQVEQVLKNLKAVLKASGADMSTVLKTEIFLTNMNDFSIVNNIYAKFFTTDPKPARQTVAVSALPKNAKIEISCIAAKIS